MKFIELFNFENASIEVNEALKTQLKSNAGKQVRWVEWTGAFKEMIAVPDVALIYAVDMNWKEIKNLVDKSEAASVVLYGCIKPILALPSLKSIYDLDDLLNYMDVNPATPTFVTTEPYPVSSMIGQTWKMTIPMNLGH